MLLNTLRSAIKNLSPAARRQAQTQTAEPVQALEERTLPAGNVIASMSGSGNLVIKGDNFNNAVTVDPIAGGIQVTGLNDLNGVPTTVNGQAVAVFIGQNFVRGNMKATMKGGDDDLLSTVSVDKNLTANMGSGSDVVDVLNTSVGGNAKINMGSTTNLLADFVNLGNVGVGGNAVIKGSKGSQNVSISNSSVQKKLTVNLGNDNDSLSIGNSFAAAFKANGGGGTDSFFLAPGGGGSVPTNGFEIFG